MKREYTVHDLRQHIEDMCECLDMHTKALISINQRLEVIAKKLNITLPEPLINMNFEEGRLRRNNVYDADIVEDEQKWLR